MPEEKQTSISSPPISTNLVLEGRDNKKQVSKPGILFYLHCCLLLTQTLVII